MVLVKLLKLRIKRIALSGVAVAKRGFRQDLPSAYQVIPFSSGTKQRRWSGFHPIEPIPAGIANGRNGAL